MPPAFDERQEILVGSVQCRRLRAAFPVPGDTWTGLAGGEHSLSTSTEKIAGFVCGFGLRCGGNGKLHVVAGQHC